MASNLIDDDVVSIEAFDEIGLIVATAERRGDGRWQCRHVGALGVEITLDTRDQAVEFCSRVGAKNVRFLTYRDRMMQFAVA